MSVYNHKIQERSLHKTLLEYYCDILGLQPRDKAVVLSV